MTLIHLMLACSGSDTPAGDTGAPDDCTETAWFLDADGDGHGGPDQVDACEAPSGYVAQSTDCDDDNADVFPDNDELCDGIDNDCDDAIDEDATDALTFYADLDGDGFGDADATILACEEGTGATTDATDCDDTEASVFPGAVEVCDGLDNDCDGTTDGDASVPADYGSITEAINAMDPGELLCVDAGTYHESITLNEHTLRIGGAGVGETVVLGGEGSALYLYNADGAEIYDMTVQGGEIRWSEDVVLKGVAISGTETYDTNTILLLDDAAATFEDVDFTENVQYATGSRAGWMVNIDGNSSLEWNGGTIGQNHIEGLGFTPSTTRMDIYGIVVVDSGELSMNGVSFIENLAGSVISHTGTSSVMANSYGLLTTYDADVELVDVDFIDNEIACVAENPAYGGSTNCRGLWSHQGSDLTQTGGNVTGNLIETFAISGAWGVIGYQSSGTFDVSDGVVSDNTLSAASGSSTWCAGLYNSGSTRYTRVELLDNVIECSGWGGFQGWIQAGSADTTLSNLVLAGNEATADGIGYAAINVQSGEGLVVENSTFHDNVLDVASGYAGLISYLPSGAGLEVVNNSFSDNELITDGDISYPGACVLYAYGLSGIAYNNLSGNTCGADAQFADHSATRDLQGQDGNDALDPGYVDAEGLDFALSEESALIDAGDPDIEDPDGSRSDIGAFGGPGSF